MTSNFPGYSRIGGERSEPEWREYSLKRISLFRHVTIPHSTRSYAARSNRQNNVKVISKRLSEAKECRNCVRVRNWFRLLFAPENSKVLLNPRPPSPRTGHHNYCPLVNHDGRQLAGGRNRISWIPVNHMRLCVRSRLWHIPCLQPPSKGDHNLQDWGPQIHQNMQLFILEAFLAFKCYLNKLKIQILAHQEAFWGSNSFTSSWGPFLEARFLEFIFHVTCFA